MINWKLRFKNKATLLAIASTVILLAQQLGFKLPDNINLSSNLDLVFQNSRKNVIVNLTKQTTKTGQLLYLMEKSSSLKLGG